METEKERTPEVRLKELLEVRDHGFKAFEKMEGSVQYYGRDLTFEEYLVHVVMGVNDECDKLKTLIEATIKSAIARQQAQKTSPPAQKRGVH